MMRGGEPMALGVNEAFPLAMFVHARCPNDIMPHHIQVQRTVVLVESVVYSGKTVVQFVQHIRDLHATIRVVVVAGVVQAQAVSEGSLATQVLAHHTRTEFSFRTTDTGNRLFNTTHLP
ncbi:hypothetical protein B0J14DRAFT_620121 [Halenospora varia]|nr:hypothetical protein B0J14DRAFT_620121 [Halenospora varia]